MITYINMIGVFIVIALYIFMLFNTIPYIRKMYKRILYTLLFFSLFFPNWEYINFGNGLMFNLQIQAIMVAGIELIDMWTKHLLAEKMKKKKLNRREKMIYESL